MKVRCKRLWAVALFSILLVMVVPSGASADYFCKPYARPKSDGIHVGTCRDIVVVPISVEN